MKFKEINEKWGLINPSNCEWLVFPNGRFVSSFFSSRLSFSLSHLFIWNVTASEHAEIHRRSSCSNCSIGSLNCLPFQVVPLIRAWKTHGRFVRRFTQTVLSRVSVTITRSKHFSPDIAFTQIHINRKEHSVASAGNGLLTSKNIYLPSAGKSMVRGERASTRGRQRIHRRKNPAVSSCRLKIDPRIKPRD